MDQEDEEVHEEDKEETTQKTNVTYQLCHVFLEESSIHGLQKLHESQSKYFWIPFDK